MNLKQRLSKYLLDWLEHRRQTHLEYLIEKKCTHALLMMLIDHRESIRLDAIHALGMCDNEIAFHALTKLLEDPLASIRKAAALSLSTMNHPGSIASIKRQLCVEKDLPVIDILHTALFRMKKRCN